MKIAYTKPAAKAPTPERRSYDEVLGVRSSSSPRGSTYWKRLRRCPREHALFEAGLRRDYGMAEHLTVGLMVHRALEGYYGWFLSGHAASKCANAEAAAWSTIAPFASEPGYEQTYALVERMLAGYFELYRETDAEKWGVHAVEETITYRSDWMEWSGRLDGLVEKDGMLWILEHKTAKVITPDLLSGYQLDMQMLGYVWLFQKCVDAAKLPPLGGIIVNILTKHTVPRYERVEVCPSKYHLDAFEESMRDWLRIRDTFGALHWPRALGACTGAPRYFSTCDYFDLCHGQPDVSLKQLLREDLPYGFTRVSFDALDPDEVS